jgi:peptide-methionine (S)-S-oxide reductase
MSERRVETATLAGGCFWCLEAVFERLQGVERVVSGFSGGKPGATSYREVCNGDTGHAEVIQITFDPGVISYHALLSFFFAFHDPTTRDRQGADVGTQYRSAIFHHGPEQERIARAVIEELTRAQVFPAPIVTELAAFDGFHAAEPHHQGYFRRNGEQPYCQAVIAPKVAKLRAHFADRLRELPASS